ncbi:hypothetical protein I3843_06G042900 [Carya illinoinensis]|uniref:Uncharacterized protein n=1 Tax=Carya illinoinensis TaxID=32201 RepID=A0A8T1Q7Z7_CARIL|nr:hypothetical protein I3760_06G046200 [Carya illinoinensis]KAG6650495.1 hypothetical protein CIPAW_06G047100 [Carya illinoinensis]KAG6707739.1 hypothetical protein I3842_06G047000 [Carya illinoinensis]KAG7974316.1 hypothetical protein I3843_06G042900 [Carya illinoinensis]
MQMIIRSEGPRSSARVPRQAGATTAIFLLWVVLIFTQISWHFAAHDVSERFFRSPVPRKEHFSETPLFHAPSSTPVQVSATNGEPDTLYEDDKRIIHTGPNPLHN